MTNSDLSQFVDSRSESALRRLVEEHSAMVFSTALRRTNGASGLAEEIVQEVFTLLARKAVSLSKDICLPGWLYRQTCRLASNKMRSENRRAKRELIAAESMNTNENDLPAEVLTTLDDLMLKLPKSARDVIVIRFFEDCDHRSVGRALGISEDAARKRIARALEKLRSLLAKKGYRISVPTLTVGLLGTSSKNISAALQTKITMEAIATPGLGAAWLSCSMNFLAGLAAVSVLAGAKVLFSSPSEDIHTSNSKLFTTLRAQPDLSPFYNLTQHDLIDQIQLLSHGPQHSFGELKLHLLLRQVPDEEIPEFIELSFDRLRSDERARCYHHLLERWMISDPARSLTYTAFTTKLKNPNPLTLNLALAWVQQDMPAALAWLASNWDELIGKELPQEHGHLREWIAQAFFHVLHDQFGPDEAANFLRTLDTQSQASILIRFCRENGQFFRPEVAPGFFLMIQSMPMELQATLSSKFWFAWSKRDALGLRNFLTTLSPKDAFQAHIHLLVHEGSEDNAYETGRNSGYDHDEVLQLIGEAILTTNSINSFKAWRSRYPNDLDFDQKILTLIPQGASTFAEGDFKRRLQLIDLLKDRSQALILGRAVTRHFISIHSSSAEKYCKNAEIKSDLKAELLKLLQP